MISAVSSTVCITTSVVLFSETCKGSNTPVRPRKSCLFGEPPTCYQYASSHSGDPCVANFISRVDEGSGDRLHTARRVRQRYVLFQRLLRCQRYREEYKQAHSSHASSTAGDGSRCC